MRPSAPLDGFVPYALMSSLYFDHNSTTLVAPEVLETLVEALRNGYGNASSIHRTGQSARMRLERARQVIAGALAASPADLVFTSGGTESNNLALFGLFGDGLKRGRHIVTTLIEHPAVLEPCRQLEREGVQVTYLQPNISGVIEASAIADAIKPETMLVSVMHANNETGVVQPLAEIGKLVSERRRNGQKLFFHSDGVQGFGKIATDMNALAVDLYAVSGHKVYGPKGIGALYIRKGVPLFAVQRGGRHERERRAGTENVPAAEALARAVQLLDQRTISSVEQLRNRFERAIEQKVDGAEINGQDVLRLPNTTSLRIDGISGESLVIALDLKGISVSTGSACSSGSIEPSPVLLAMGQSRDMARSTVRISFGLPNTEADVNVLSAAVVDAVRRFRAARRVAARYA